LHPFSTCFHPPCILTTLSRERPFPFRLGCPFSASQDPFSPTEFPGVVWAPDRGRSASSLTVCGRGLETYQFLLKRNAVSARRTLELRVFRLFPLCTKAPRRAGVSLSPTFPLVFPSLLYHVVIRFRGSFKCASLGHFRILFLKCNASAPKTRLPGLIRWRSRQQVGACYLSFSKDWFVHIPVVVGNLSIRRNFAAPAKPSSNRIFFF